MQLQARRSSINTTSASTASASQASAAAALAAFVRAAAAEAPSIAWSCSLLDSASVPDASPSLQDAYGGKTAASLASRALLTEAPAVQLLLKTDSPLGTIVITGGLGGLGSMAAAALAEQSAAAAHLVLLGRSGRASASNSSLQAIFAWFCFQGLQCRHLAVVQVACRSIFLWYSVQAKCCKSLCRRSWLADAW